MRLLALACLALVPPTSLGAQALTRADTALVLRILDAEDRRDSTDAALGEGVRHGDARVRDIARRARWRIADPKFAARDSLPVLPAPPAWAEPAWRLRYRALTAQGADCAAMRNALSDEAGPVRLRAAALVDTSCRRDEALLSVLRGWVDGAPARAGTREWHAAAHGVVALARLRADAAGDRVRAMARHADWHLRTYAARAATLAADTATLHRLAGDANANVQEAAIDGLARLAGHAADSVYFRALGGDSAQAVRAAAVALKGSTRPDLPRLAAQLHERWLARGNASERDVRVALLELAGRSADADRLTLARPPLPAEAAALAFGAERRVRVTLAPASGGGSFVVRLRGDVAPITAARVLALVRQGYYDGLTWHRVEPDFVIQGGSRGDNEYVGYAHFLRDELGAVPHRRGTVGMSTRGHDTGDAQWFLNLKDNLRLGGDYTVFGEVVEGIEVVDGVREGDVIASVREVVPIGKR